MKTKQALPRPAMDAIIQAAVRQAERDTIARLNAIRAAEAAVRPHVGELPLSLDSAEAVYKMALDAAKIDLTGVPAAAYAAMVRMLPNKSAAQNAMPVAMDAAASQRYAERFPNSGRLGRQ